MAPVETRYLVPGWGAGELWSSDGVVLAHDFRFDRVSDTGGSGGVDASRSDLAEPDGPNALGRTNAQASSGGQLDAELSTLALGTIRCLTPDSLVHRVRAFLAGDAVDFRDVPLDLAWATTFQRSLADALREVPWGDVVSYGELAALAGRPGAARAAGAFCADNRFAFFLPCHRVVGASDVGGYGSAGLGVKRRLLALEGVEL